ncbi:MAG: flagellar hook capping FlgD N-terminal domain-containing protein [Pirellulaceae bacterium]
MTKVDSSAAAASGSSKNSVSQGGMAELDPNDFLKLLIAELQNQDPMEPMKNAEMMQQIGQIREIAATDKLTGTLDKISAGQNIATASSMIGRQVQAMNKDGDVVFGVVRSIQFIPGNDGRELQLKIDTGEQIVDMNIEDVFHILPAASQQPEAPGEIPDDLEVDPPVDPDEPADPDDEGVPPVDDETEVP